MVENVFGQVVVPLLGAYAVVLAVILGVARAGRRPGEGRPRTPGFASAVVGLLRIMIPGVVAFLGAVGGWCAGVDDAPGACAGEALREGTFLAFGVALPVLVAVTALARLRSRG